MIENLRRAQSARIGGKVFGATALQQAADKLAAFDLLVEYVHFNGDYAASTPSDDWVRRVRAAVEAL